LLERSHPAAAIAATLNVDKTLRVRFIRVLVSRLDRTGGAGGKE
jgi:hypothetical protein